MHTPFFEIIKYFFLCLSSLEIMHLLMKSKLNFTYILLAALILTVLYAFDIRKPASLASKVKADKKNLIQSEEKAL